MWVFKVNMALKSYVGVSTAETQRSRTEQLKHSCPHQGSSPECGLKVLPRHGYKVLTHILFPGASGFLEALARKATHTGRALNLIWFLSTVLQSPVYSKSHCRMHWEAEKVKTVPWASSKVMGTLPALALAPQELWSCGCAILMSLLMATHV